MNVFTFTFIWRVHGGLNPPTDILKQSMIETIERISDDADIVGGCTEINVHAVLEETGAAN